MAASLRNLPPSRDRVQTLDHLRRVRLSHAPRRHCAIAHLANYDRARGNEGLLAAIQQRHDRDVGQIRFRSRARDRSLGRTQLAAVERLTYRGKLFAVASSLGAPAETYWLLHNEN